MECVRLLRRASARKKTARSCQIKLRCGALKSRVLAPQFWEEGFYFSRLAGADQNGHAMLSEAKAKAEKEEEEELSNPLFVTGRHEITAI